MTRETAKKKYTIVGMNAVILVTSITMAGIFLAQAGNVSKY